MSACCKGLQQAQKVQLFQLVTIFFIWKVEILNTSLINNGKRIFVKTLINLILFLTLG